jgi:hypothetical protein
MDHSRITLLLLVIVVSVAASVMFRNVLWVREKYSAESRLPLPASSKTYYVQGVKQFMLGGDVQDMTMSFSKNDAACTFMTDRKTCKPLALDAVTCPSDEQMCTTTNAIAQPQNPSDCTLSIHGKQYRFLKTCVQLVMLPNGFRNDTKDALFLALSRSVFVRPQRSFVYSAADVLQYQWPTPVHKWAMSPSSVDSQTTPRKRLDELIAQAGGKSVDLNTTCYYLEPVLDDNSACGTLDGTVRTLTTEGSLSLSTTMYQHPVTAGPHVITFQLKSPNSLRVAVVRNDNGNVIYENAYRLSEASEGRALKFCWCVTNSAILLMVYVPAANGRKEAVFMNVAYLKGVNLLRGIQSVPPGASCIIPGLWSVYKRFSAPTGISSDFLPLPTSSFTLRPTAIASNKCLTSIDDNSVSVIGCGKDDKRQLWTFDKAEGKITSGDICLQEAENREQVLLSKCTQGNPGQSFKYIDTRQIQSQNSNKCLTLTKDGASLQMAACLRKGNNWQQVWETTT